MKKILIITLMLFLTYSAGAFEITDYKGGKFEKLVPEIGFRLLNSNSIPNRMIFTVTINNKTINAFTRSTNREITITTALLKYIENNDELAAILAHEISHGVDSYKGAFNGAFSSLNYHLNPKKYEYKADQRAIDYMVKAGYNPIAYITIANRIFPQEHSEWSSTHPLSSKRLAYVYEYIYMKYPEYLVNNEYKENIYYQNFLLTSKENRKKLEQKVKSNSTKKINYQ